jgi:hypothetical protein
MGLNMESQIRDLRYSAAIRTKELEKRIAQSRAARFLREGAAARGTA